MRVFCAAFVQCSFTLACPPTPQFAADTEAITLEPAILGEPETYLPVYRHHPAQGHDPEIGLIVLHGMYRDAFHYYALAIKAMKNAKAEDRTVIITPGFLDQPCNKSRWLNNLQVQGRAAEWTHGVRKWVNGQTSDAHPGWNGISSYEAIDRIIEWLELKYPSLEQIVVAGWSAGAQMGLRWSVVSSQGVQGITNGGTPLLVVLGSPSSVLYLNSKRPAKECVLDRDTGPLHTCPSFLVPGTGGNAARTCMGHYDNYPFGLSCLEEGSKVKDGDTEQGTTEGDVSDYIHQYLEDVTRIKHNIPANFRTKDVLFVFGDRDTKPCTIGTCADDCAALVQGSNRLQRNLNYMSHLRDVFHGYEPRFSVFQGGHACELFFASDAFNGAVFGAPGFAEYVYPPPVRFAKNHAVLCAVLFVSCVVALCLYVARRLKADPSKD